MREGSFLKLVVLLSIGMCTVATAAGEIPSGKQDPHETMKGPYGNGTAVTAECLKCHEDKAKEILDTAHWRWTGPSPFTQGHEKRTDLGKRNLLNNF
jgi:hypothetical protein